MIYTWKSSALGHFQRYLIRKIIMDPLGWATGSAENHLSNQSPIYKESIHFQLPFKKKED